MAKKQKVKYEGNNYQYTDFDPMNAYAKRYEDLATETQEVSDKKYQEVRENIKPLTNKIYKYYLKQGAGYGISFAVAFAGIVGLASGTLPVMALGGALLFAGALGASVTRFGRSRRNELQYNIGMDRKRVRYFWREARRVRKIDRYILTLQDLRRNHPERVDKARSLSKRIKREIDIYERKAFEEERKVKQDIIKHDAKMNKPDGAFTRFANWLGFHAGEDAREIKDRQLRAFRDEFIYSQLLNAQYLRAAAGLEASKKIDDYVANRAKENQKFAEKEIERIEKANKKRSITETADEHMKRTENKNNSSVVVDHIKEKIKAEKLDSKELQTNIFDLATQLGVTTEELFNIAKSVKFGKQSKVSFINGMMPDLSELSKECRKDMVDLVKDFKEKDYESFKALAKIYQENCERRGKDKKANQYKKFVDKCETARQPQDEEEHTM